MKLQAVIQKKYQVQSQLIVDYTKSFWGEILGSFIQPAQKKEAIPHLNKKELKEQAEKKIESLERKLLDPLSKAGLINKWEKKRQQYFNFFDATEHCSHDYLTITTIEGRTLDCVQISPSVYNDIEPAKQYYNVHLLGAKQMYGDRMIDLYREAHKQNVNVIAFDYSNIGYSTGSQISCLNRMIADASAVIQCLLEQGVPANHITLHGFSLGGLIGTILAANCHQNNLTVNIYTTCTPMELTPCILNFLTFIPVFLQGTVKYLLDSFGWDTDATSLWKSIPEEYKEFSFIDVENGETQMADNFIPVSATIYSRQKLSDSFDVEFTKKSHIIDNSTSEHYKNIKTDSLIRYRDMLNIQPIGHYHHFYLEQRDKKKKNPHGTNQYLLFNKVAQNTPEDLFESFEAFIELRNQNSLS